MNEWMNELNNDENRVYNTLVYRLFFKKRIKRDDIWKENSNNKMKKNQMNLKNRYEKKRRKREKTWWKIIYNRSNVLNANVV